MRRPFATDTLVVEAAVEQIEPAQLQQMMLSYALLPQGSFAHAVTTDLRKAR